MVVRLTAPILSTAIAPAFTGSIEADVIAENLPEGDTGQNADFGKHCLSNVHLCTCYHITPRLRCSCSQSLVQLHTVHPCCSSSILPTCTFMKCTSACLSLSCIVNLVFSVRLLAFEVYCHLHCVCKCPLQQCGDVYL